MSLEMTNETLLDPNEYTILIVDDNPQNLKVIDIYLRKHGFKTLIASKGELALNRVQHISPDLILLDVLMPGIDGFETCQRLKADQQTRDIPVIFMTALTETSHKLKGFQVGGVDYITKPFQQEEVLARVKTHLQIQKEMAERKRAEAALREAHEEIIRLEKATLELKMAGGFAHEMRNALTGIQLALHLVIQQGQTLCEKNVETLGEVFHVLEPYIPQEYWEKVVQEFEMIDEHEETLNNVISLIRDHTTRAMEVTTLILNYARLGWAEIGEEDVYLPSLIESIIQEHAQEFQEQQITLRSRLSSTRSLVGNPAHFYMMINNIVLNARDALLELVDGRERVIDISLCENDRHQILHITDNANGIPDDHLIKIFDPFFSTKPTTGTGLGLSVVSKLVPMYRGTIDVTSKEGEGTTFTFTFPVHEDSPK